MVWTLVRQFLMFVVKKFYWAWNVILVRSERTDVREGGAEAISRFTPPTSRRSQLKIRLSVDAKGPVPVSRCAVRPVRR